MALKKMKSKRNDLITLKDPDAKYPLPLIEKEQINHNTRRFRFGLPSPDHVLGLPVGNYIHLLAQIGNELVIRAYTPVSSDDDQGFVDLIIKTEEDIVMRKELEDISMTHFHQFKLWFTLDRPPTGWKYSSGFVTANMIKEHLPPPGKATLILVCGPPPLIQTAAYPSLEQLGYTKDMVFTY